MEEEIQTLLDGAASFPVAWGRFGSDATFPRAAIFRTSGARSMHSQGTGLMSARVQVDCYGDNFAEAITASRVIRGALEGYQGGSIQGAFLESIRDTNATDVESVDRVSITFSVTYTD